MTLSISTNNIQQTKIQTHSNTCTYTMC